ncbi:uncharacterized protein LOC143814649 [Ranitomeya variabilis]|uniref:uncharacterized protein LOC143814649 n=1 Tax=Ranitomeya variabilis TaxID=490064 RepID=UPI004055FCE5
MANNLDIAEEQALRDLLDLPHENEGGPATFLDLKISIRDKDLVTDLYCKATATNSLLRALTSRFRQRGYPKKTLSRAFQRAKELNQDLLICPSDRHQDGSVRFITDFNDQ